MTVVCKDRVIGQLMRKVLFILLSLTVSVTHANSASGVASNAPKDLIYIQNEALDFYTEALNHSKRPLGSVFSKQQAALLEISNQQVMTSANVKVAIANIKNWIALLELDLRAQSRSSREIWLPNEYLVGKDPETISQTSAQTACSAAKVIDVGAFAVDLTGGSKAWFAIDMDETSRFQLSTAGSRVDTELVVFSDHCPGEQEAEMALQDNDFGLFAMYESGPEVQLTRRYFSLSSKQSGISISFIHK